jgi:hypothetical protein
MADRGGPRRTGSGCRHSRVSVPELPAPRGRQRCAHAHRPLVRAVTIDATGRRLAGSALVVAAGGRERSRSHPCRHRGNRRRGNADPAALRRPGGRPVADPEGVGPWKCRFPDACGHEDARRRRFDDSGREPGPNRGTWHRATATGTAADRSSTSGRGPDPNGSHSNADADTQPDGHTDGKSVTDADTQPDPDTQPVAIGQPEPVMRSRLRALSEWGDCATLVRVLR